MRFFFSLNECLLCQTHVPPLSTEQRHGVEYVLLAEGMSGLKVLACGIKLDVV